MIHYHWHPDYNRFDDLKANREHLDILKKGVEAWNQWRQENKPARPSLPGIEAWNEWRSATGGADLSHADLSGADLRGANLTHINLGLANLREADLRSAHCFDANFIGANLRNADLVHTDFRRAQFCFADLTEANLYEARLIQANFYGYQTKLCLANLRNAKLSGADLRGANLYGADLSHADLSGADLTEANLRETTLVETDLTAATLTQCSIYGISAWNVQLEGAKQDSLIITRDTEPTVTVDNLKIAQFIYLMLNNQELREVIDTIGQKGVLILGRFGDGGLKMLQAIAAELRKMKYLPMIFDFERPDNRNYTETVKTLVGLARFVIVDLSGPSVPQELYATIPHFKIPFVPILEEGRKTYAMFADLLEYPWVFPPVAFRDKEQLMELLPSRIIEPAEKKCQERQIVLNQLFNR